MSKFHDIIAQIVALHDQKQKDYGKDDDPFANVRAAEDFGLPGYVGALIRMNDKMRRLQKFVEKGELANESVEDAFMDLAVYAVIGLILYQEHVQEPTLEDIAKKPITGFSLFKMSKPQTFTTEFKVPHNFFWSSLLRGGDEAKACDHLNEWGEPYTDSPWMKGQKCPKCGVTL